MAYYSETDDLTFTPLTAKEEAKLFRTFYSKKLPESKRLAARDCIIQHHLKFTAKVAIACAKRSLPDEDAISAGNFGLLKALESKRFDPRRGFRFSSYVKISIRSQVFAAMRELSITKCEAPLIWKRSKDGELTVTGHQSHYLPVTGNPHPMENSLEYSEEHPFEETDLATVRRRALEAAICRLGEDEAEIVRQHDFKGRTFDSIGKSMKASRQNCHQTYLRAVQKLRRLLSNRDDLR